MIDDFNQQNLGDLDALYFNDKVNTTNEVNFSQTSFIPRLDLSNLEEKKNILFISIALLVLK